MNKLRGKRGISLVSLVAAIAVLTVALSAVTSVFFSVSNLTRHASQFTAASNFAEGVMERACSRPWDQVRSGEIKEGLPNIPGANCRMEVSEPEPGLKQVVVTFSWLEAKTNRSTRFSTLLAKGEAR